MRDQSGHSPTRTATRTEAHTQGNYTVTGGAGSGDTTVNFLKGGMDWKSVFQSIPAGATARALALALSPITGGVPAVTSRGDYSEITFTPEQEERLSAWILTQLRREPGPVRIQSGGVATKVIVREYWPWMLGFVAVGVTVGYMASKGGRRWRTR